MTKPSIPLGLVFSQSGPYAMMAGEMRKSALMAVDEINHSDEFDFTFTPHLRDPGGVVAGYHTACADLIREEHVGHIVGCYTSASRKQVIPIVERTERLLWHPARYEGFESSDNVIYVGAAPNQHVVPLVRHMLDHISTAAIALATAFCITIVDAQAWDDSKYPDLKGQWVRANGARGRSTRPRWRDFPNVSAGRVAATFHPAQE